VLESAIVSRPPQLIEEGLLPARIRHARLRSIPLAGIDLPQILEDFEHSLIATALGQTKGNQTKAAPNNHRLTKEFIAIGDYIDLAARQSTFEALGGYGSFQANIFGLGEPFRVVGLLAAPGLLETLRVRPVLGRSLQPDDSRQGAAPVMLLGYDLWQSHPCDNFIFNPQQTVDSFEENLAGA